MEDTPTTLKSRCRQNGIERMAKIRRTLSRNEWICDSDPGSYYYYYYSTILVAYLESPRHY
jgi:hypothetical protein